MAAPRSLPLLAILDSLSAGFAEYGVDEALRRHLRDVADHATIVVGQADSFRDILAVGADPVRSHADRHDLQQPVLGVQTPRLALTR